MSSLLVAHAAEHLGADHETFERMTHPDDVIPIPVGERFVAFRSRDFIPSETGHTQGGFRIKRFDDSELNGQTPLDLDADEREARELSADMTPKLGFILRSLRIGIERGVIDPAFSLPETGGAKCVLSLPNSVYQNSDQLGDYLDTLVDNYMHGFVAGDGFGPDMGVDSAKMRHMSQRAAEVFPDLEHHFTNKPNGFPGRESATGDLSVSALYQTLTQKNVDVPHDKRTIALQGLGSAGGWAERKIQELMAPDDYRVVAVADADMGLVAKDQNRGIVQDKDYLVDVRGRIITNSATLEHADFIEPKDILYQDAGIKIAAAIGGVIGKKNWRQVAEGTIAIGEIANLGIDADAALEIEKEQPGLEIVPVPLMSAGGVIISLFERHRNTIESKLGREVTAEDTKHIITQLAKIGAEILAKERDAEMVGSFTGAYRVGLDEQYGAHRK